MPAGPGEITRLLSQWREGRQEALERLMPLVYEELRALARSHLARERPGHTLQATALVHEAYVRMANRDQVDWESRAQFFGFAARLIRNILVDHARAHNAEKRGAGFGTVPLNEIQVEAASNAVDIVELNDALEALEAMDERQAKIVDMRYFGGLTIEETAEVMKLSPATVKAEWAMARAWLLRKMAPEKAG